MLLTSLQEADILVSHPYKDRWALDDKADIHSQEVSAELVKQVWIILKFIDESSAHALQFFCKFIFRNLIILWHSIVIKTELLKQFLLLLKNFVYTRYYLLCLLLRGIMNCHITCVFIVTHLWLLVVESLLLSEDFKNVNLALESRVKFLNFPHIIGKMSAGGNN